VFVFKAAVVGAGTMGAEIAQAIADAEIPVVLKDVDETIVARGLATARSVWQARVDAGKLQSDELERKAALITGATSYGAFGDVDFVIEAVPERIELKRLVFSELDEVTPGHAILASNTSSLPITEIGEVTHRPDKVLGFHFFYPASAMRAVEVIEGDDTSADTVQAAITFAQAIRKAPIRCADAPGFVVNRILTSAMSELWRCQDESDLDVGVIDAIVTDAKATPTGPFWLADRIGLDTVLAVATYLNESYGERFFVPKRLAQLVAAGQLGAKTGRGFYEHGA
jgi:3-hydroxyacyl-CoA dehydrogenase